MSSIDPTVPTQGVDNSSQKLRDNFVAAASEIDALDARVTALEQTIATLMQTIATLMQQN